MGGARQRALSLIDIPFDVMRLILLPGRGRAGERAALLGHEAHRAPSRTIETIPPPGNFADGNEADQAGHGCTELA